MGNTLICLCQTTTGPSLRWTNSRVDGALIHHHDILVAPLHWSPVIVNTTIPACQGIVTSPDTKVNRYFLLRRDNILACVIWLQHTWWHNWIIHTLCIYTCRKFKFWNQARLKVGELLALVSFSTVSDWDTTKSVHVTMIIIIDWEQNWSFSIAHATPLLSVVVVVVTAVNVVYYCSWMFINPTFIKSFIDDIQTSAYNSVTL